MSEYLIHESDMISIADAIREKTGKSDKINFNDMANEIAGISTGAELNFEVIGSTTEPENPTENMIWVNTDVPITEYYFSDNEPSTGLRYIKLVMDSIVSGSIVQIGDLRFVDDNGNFFTYPSTVSATSSITASSGEEAIKLTDNNTSTKFCSSYWISGSYIIIDLGENNSIDIVKYNRWQWYTANDTASSSGRNLKTFSLWGSKDNNEFILLDSVTDYSAPTQNQVLAYTGSIQNTSKFYDTYTNGDVFFHTGKGLISFNALEKNGIPVYPMIAKQYIGGAWVEKIAKCYQNGEWVEIEPYQYIFKQGRGSDSEFISKPYYRYQSNMTTERIYCNAPQSTESDGASGLADSYDFTDYSLLVFDLMSNNRAFTCGYLDTFVNSYNQGFVGSVSPPTGSRTTVRIDISGVTGKKFIGFKIGNGAAGAVEIYNVYLKP